MINNYEQNFEQITKKTKRFFSLPSIALGIYHNGKEQYYTFGSRAPLAGSVDQNTVYPIASASKAFIATSAMILVEQGKLDLDKPLTYYLEDFELFTDDLTKNLTVRDALCHRSGLPRHDVTLFTCPDVALHDMVHNMRYLEPAYALRERFHYQNHMFAAISVLVEKLSGKPWGSFVQDEIFTPLGMTRSYTVSQYYEKVDKNYARPFATVSGMNIPIKNMRADNTGCAGAISASVKDLLSWAKLNLFKGKTSNDSRVFSEDSSVELHKAQMTIKPNDFSPYSTPDVSDLSYGLGWFIENYKGTKFIYHGGTLMGFKSLVGFLPNKDFAFAVLVNQNGSAAPSAIGYTLCDMILGQIGRDWNRYFKETIAKIGGENRQKFKKAQEKPETAPAQSGLTGDYFNPAYNKMTVENKGKELILHISSIHAKIVPSTLDDFVIVDKTTGLYFPCHFEGKEGAVSGLYAKLDEDLASYIYFEKI